MLNKEQEALWQTLQASLSTEQRVWLAGYAQGMVSAGLSGEILSATQNTAQQKLSVYFATETGNSKTIAQQLAKAAKAQGWNAQAAPIKRLKPADIARLENPAVFVAATHGEGDPPEPAIEWFKAMQALPEKQASSLQYSVLGLGDSSYPEYCKFSRDLEAELKRLGGKSVHDYTEYDVDFAAHTDSWIAALLKSLPQQNATAVSPSFAANAPVLATGKGYSRLEPITAIVSNSVNLNDQGSAKQTYHIELTCDTPLQYQPGDAVGIILPAAGEGMDMTTPRLYSLASAPQAHGDQLHVTVALAWHKDADGIIGYGLCSHYLSNLQAGDAVQCYIQQNQLFRLPNDDKDIIMIGPGTGVAPFRSFLWERAERGATGRNWLFFGEQHAHCDFLYQAEWIEHVESGLLTEIDLAFSRDQAEKIYVQDRMRAKGAALVEWLDNGASLYLCGNKDPMSRDVDAALLEIIAAHKGGAEQAEAYIERLEDENRYIKDVY